MNRDLIPWMQTSSQGMGLDFWAAQGKDPQQALGLGAIIGKVVFARIHFDTDIALDRPLFFCLYLDLIPATQGRLKVIVKKGVAVAVIGSSPRKQHAFLGGTGVNVVAVMAVPQASGHPALLRRKPLRRKRSIQEPVGHMEDSGHPWFGGQDASIRIKQKRAFTGGQCFTQIPIQPKQVIH